jgi:hypothetical protein
MTKSLKDMVFEFIGRELAFWEKAGLPPKTAAKRFRYYAGDMVMDIIKADGMRLDNGSYRIADDMIVRPGNMITPETPHNHVWVVDGQNELPLRQVTFKSDDMAEWGSW